MCNTLTAARCLPAATETERKIIANEMSQSRSNNTVLHFLFIFIVEPVFGTQAEADLLFLLFLLLPARSFTEVNVSRPAFIRKFRVNNGWRG